jgi:hypothetical protein
MTKSFLKPEGISAPPQIVQAESVPEGVLCSFWHPNAKAFAQQLNISQRIVPAQRRFWCWCRIPTHLPVVI